MRKPPQPKKKTTNSRNGSYQKRVKGEFGNLDIAVRRDRDSSFDEVVDPTIGGLAKVGLHLE